jgi:phosphoglycerate kinase
MQTITELGNITGKRILLRLDLNVPVRDGIVINDFRIRRAIPTIRLLEEHDGIIIILSHIAEKEGGTLVPVFKKLQQHMDVTFVGDPLSESGREQIANAEPGDVLLCENIRNYKGEKANDTLFAEELARLGDIFINDAFSASHRSHASIVTLPKLLPSFAGPLFYEEMNNLEIVKNPPSPSLFIIGGAKFDTKIPLIEHFLNRVDMVFVGGALANLFFKAKGFNVGGSLLSDSYFDVQSIISNDKLLLPVDIEVQSGDGIFARALGDVAQEDKILDVGPKTMDMLTPLIKKARLILWNGPLGNYEAGFRQHTGELASLIAQSDAISIVGGGDTVISITELGIEDKFDFLSTAGGAMVYYLSHGTLPGIDALS